MIVTKTVARPATEGRKTIICLCIMNDDDDPRARIDYVNPRARARNPRGGRERYKVVEIQLNSSVFTSHPPPIDCFCNYKLILYFNISG